MQRIIAKKFLYKFLILCIAIFSLSFLTWSEFGLIKHFRIKKEFCKKQHELIALQKEVKKLKKKLTAWKTDPFYIEKMAREELCMGYPNEVVYLFKR